MKDQAHHLKSGAAVLAICLAAAAPTRASAQESANAEERADQEIQEILVTATKREVRLQDVPVSVAVIPSEQLRETGTLSTSDLPNLAPGLFYSPAASIQTTQFIIRGVGTFAVTNALETSVGVTVDGVPVARPAGQVADMIDIDHVEVLKGPQGTLFGKNATAGVIAITTRKPVLGDTSLEGNISFGSYRELNIDVAHNIALGDKAALRVTAWRNYHDGYIDSATDDFEYGDKNTWGLRVGARAEPTERLSLTLIGQYDGRDERGNVALAAAFTGRTRQVFVDTAAALGIVPSLTNRTADTAIRPISKGENYYLTGLVDYELGGGYTLSSVSSYRRIDLDNQSNPLGFTAPTLDLTIGGNEKSDTFSQELRIASPAEQPLSFVAGLYYFAFDVDQIQYQYGIALPTIGGLSIINPQSVRQKNYAAFGEMTYRILPNLRLLAGIRQSHDRVEGTYVRSNVTPPTPPVPGSFAPVSVTPPRLTYDFTSYRFGAQFDATPDVMVYATASRGYKGPGYNFTPSITPTQVAQFGVEVKPETVRSYEVGLKGQFFDRRLSFNIAAYHSTFRNFQATTAVSVNPLVYSVQNAGELTSQGVEFDLSARPVRGLTLGLAGAYTDAKFTDFATAPCYGGQPTLPAGSPLTPGFCVGGVQSLDGVRVPQAPKWSFNGRARYEADIGTDWTAFVNVDANYSSKIKFEATNDPFNVQKAYAVANLSLGFGPQDKSWTLSLYARNIFDESFASRRRENSGVYQQFFAYESTRRIGMNLNFQF